MKKSDAEEYTQALGQVVAGGWRQIALGQRLGVPKALGLTNKQWVKERLGGYVKMSLKDVAEAAKELEGDGYSERKIPDVLGVDRNTVRKALGKSRSKGGGISTSEGQEQADIYGADGCNSTTSEPFDIMTGLVANDEMRREAERQEKKEIATEESRAKREASRQATPRPDGYDLRIGDARDVLADIPDASVHLVLTDPPYGDDAEPLYRWLATWSARVLVDGGSLICFTGQSRLDRDMRLLNEHLRYWWLLAMRHNQAQRLPGKFVMAEFKPVLWFVKDHRRGRTLVNDVLRSDRRDKSGHDWGQGDGGVELLIEQLTDPDEHIIDPFAGTGKWGEIAARMGRFWIGVDIVEGGTAAIQLA